jgi:hypothetical protein
MHPEYKRPSETLCVGTVSRLAYKFCELLIRYWIRIDVEGAQFDIPNRALPVARKAMGEICTHEKSPTAQKNHV